MPDLFHLPFLPGILKLKLLETLGQSRVTTHVGQWWRMPAQHSGGRGRRISVNLKPVWSTVPGQPRLHRETLSQKTKQLTVPTSWAWQSRPVSPATGKTKTGASQGQVLHGLQHNFKTGLIKVMRPWSQNKFFKIRIGV